jgi:uncharacterized protein
MPTIGLPVRRWLITKRVTDNPAAICEFNDIGYRYDEALSRPGEPAFVCQAFGGKGPVPSAHLRP